MANIIEKTLHHGVDGPAVSLWVVTCLLDRAEKHSRDVSEVCALHPSMVTLCSMVYQRV